MIASGIQSQQVLARIHAPVRSAWSVWVRSVSLYFACSTSRRRCSISGPQTPFPPSEQRWQHAGAGTRHEVLMRSIIFGRCVSVCTRKYKRSTTTLRTIYKCSKSSVLYTRLRRFPCARTHPNGSLNQTTVHRQYPRQSYANVCVCVRMCECGPEEVRTRLVCTKLLICRVDKGQHLHIHQLCLMCSHIFDVPVTSLQRDGATASRKPLAAPANKDIDAQQHAHLPRACL